jgi:hypothetical protein
MTIAWSSRISGSGSQRPRTWGFVSEEPDLEGRHPIDLARHEHRPVEQERRLRFLDDLEARALEG